MAGPEPDTSGTRMKILLLSTYDLGHQPFALSSAAAWLTADGQEVSCNDLAVEGLNEAAVRDAGLIAVHMAMHTATRLTLDILPRLRALNRSAHFVFFGLYAPMAKGLIDSDLSATFIGGEFEPVLRDISRQLGSGKMVNGSFDGTYLNKQNYPLPARDGLPSLTNYTRLETAGDKTIVTGYTEASRGCKHLCRHCPVVPVYGGRFFAVQRATVLDDIEQQVTKGARHICFGDPDFFNGPAHGMRIVRELHQHFPEITYDVTIKIEHLLKHRALLPGLQETGCLFITTAVESVDDDVLDKLDKGHSKEDFITAVALARDNSLILSPTFIPFTPWTTVAGYRSLLESVVALDLIDNVSPIQLAIRLLIPAGSRLLELDDFAFGPQDFDREMLSYRWTANDPRVDRLGRIVQEIVETGDSQNKSRREIFGQIWQAAHEADGQDTVIPPVGHDGAAMFVPRMSEPWYCCAEPTSSQRQRI